MSAVSERAAAVALASLPRVGPARLAALLSFPSAVEAWDAVRDASALARSPALARACLGETPDLATTWRDAAREIDPAARLARAEDAGMTVRTIDEPDYPAALRDDVEPPAVAFWYGTPPHDERPTVAIVGTRNATRTGLTVAHAMGRRLAEAGVRVLSGLALGIDAAAHRGALASGATSVAGVVGTGLDVVYPRRNAPLWEQVRASGWLLSEAPPGVGPSGWRFPARNRIIAALADVVVVVESREDGGSMHTVREALHRGRQVMAVPGSLRNPAAAGTNRLLHEGASPARDADDVLVALGLARAGRRRSPTVRPRLGGLDGKVLAALADGPLDLGGVSVAAGCSLTDAAVALGRLEMAGRVVASGAWWEQRQRSRS